MTRAATRLYLAVALLLTCVAHAASATTLWGMNPSGEFLHTIDPLTGVNTFVAPIPAGFGDIEFAPDGTLWGMNPSGEFLHTIDPLTGVNTFVAPTIAFGDIDFAPVPEPGTGLLLGAGCMGLAVFRRRRV